MKPNTPTDIIARAESYVDVRSNANPRHWTRIANKEAYAQGAIDERNSRVRVIEAKLTENLLGYKKGARILVQEEERKQIVCLVIDENDEHWGHIIYTNGISFEKIKDTDMGVETLTVYISLTAARLIALPANYFDE